MKTPFLHEELMPVGLPDLFDIGKRALARLAEDVACHFPWTPVAPNIAAQVDRLFCGHPEEQTLRERHRLSLEWLKQRHG